MTENISTEQPIEQPTTPEPTQENDEGLWANIKSFISSDNIQIPDEFEQFKEKHQKQLEKTMDKHKKEIEKIKTDYEGKIKKINGRTINNQYWLKDLINNK